MPSVHVGVGVGVRWTTTIAVVNNVRVQVGVSVSVRTSDLVSKRMLLGCLLRGCLCRPLEHSGGGLR